MTNILPNPDDPKSFDQWWSDELLQGKTATEVSENIETIGTELSLVRASMVIRLVDGGKAKELLRKPLTSPQKNVRLFAKFYRAYIEYVETYQERSKPQSSHFKLFLNGICDDAENIFPNSVAVEIKARALNLLAMCHFDSGDAVQAADCAYQSKVYAETLGMSNFLNIATIEYANYLACLGEFRHGIQELNRINESLENNIGHLRCSFVYRAIMNMWLGQDRIALKLANSFEPSLYFWRDYILCLLLEKNTFNPNGYDNEILPTHSEINHFKATSLLCENKEYGMLMEIEKLSIGIDRETHFSAYSDVLRGIAAMYRGEIKMAKRLVGTTVFREFFAIRALQKFAKLEIELRMLESSPADLGAAFGELQEYLAECNAEQLQSAAHKARILAPRALAVAGNFMNMGSVLGVYGKQISFQVSSKVKLNNLQVQPLHLAVATFRDFGIKERHHFNSLQNSQIELATTLKTEFGQYIFEPVTPAFIFFVGQKLIEAGRISQVLIEPFKDLNTILPKTSGFEIEKRKALGAALTNLLSKDFNSHEFLQNLKPLQL